MRIKAKSHKFQATKISIITYQFKVKNLQILSHSKDILYSLICFTANDINVFNIFKLFYRKSKKEKMKKFPKIYL